MEYGYNSICNWVIEGAYVIYRNGDIFSVDRVVEDKNGNKKTLSGKKLAVSHNKEGYPVVCLSHNGKIKSYTISSLMVRAFYPEYNYNVHSICYKDGDKSNVNINNLVIVDSSCTIRVTLKNYEILCEMGLV